MVERIIRRSYSQVITVLEKREELVNRDFTNKVQLIEESIGHLFCLDDLIEARHHRRYRKTQKYREVPKALLSFLYKKNNHYLVSAYILALKGLNNPTYSILRSVYEGVLEMYTIHLTGKDSELLSEQETEQLNRNRGEKPTKKKKYFRHSEIIKLLYQDPTQEKMRDFYGVVSESTHPSVRGIMASFRYSKEATEDVLTLILGLIFANIVVIHEIYSDELKESEKIKTDDILNKMGQELGEVTYLVPDKPEFAERLNIKF